MENSQQLTKGNISVCIKIANSTEKASTNGLMVEHTLVIIPTTRRRASESTPGRTERNTKDTGGTDFRMGSVALPILKVNRA